MWARHHIPQNSHGYAEDHRHAERERQCPVHLVVFFEDDLLAVETQPLEDSAYVVDHRFESADVDVEIAPIADGFE
jgi:hypothetical protein